MTCREFADFMADYVSGELPPTSSMIFEEHLGICPSCVAYLANYEATIKAGKRAFAKADQDELPPSVPEALVRAILAARPR